MNQSLRSPKKVEIMEVTLIDTPQAFDLLRRDWNTLYVSDPDAHLFLTWSWLETAFRANPGRWSVLSVRSRVDGRLVGALPLKYRVHWSRSRKELQTEIESATRLLSGLYSGYLCDPAHEAEVAQALGNALAQIPWVRFSLENMVQVSRATRLEKAISSVARVKTASDGARRKQRTASLILTLPDSVEEHISDQVPQDLMNFYMNWLESLRELGPEALQVENARQAEQALVELRSLAEVSESSSREQFERTKSVLEIAQKTNRLVLVVLRNGGHLVGGIAHVHDPVLGTLYRIASVFEARQENRQNEAGLTLHAVRWAIENECIFYDFGRVSSEKALGLPVLKEESVSLAVSRNPQEDLRLDPLCTKLGIERISKMIDAGAEDDARALCRQLSRLLGQD